METEDDLGIRVWVGNLGKYVEGELKGGWASLPMPQRELNRFLRDTVGLGPEAPEARATGRVYEEYVFCFNVCSTGSAVFFRSVG